jgi:diguanylate cyclase (GGDEF)-like protein/PAS domain S-box-containing protein
MNEMIEFSQLADSLFDGVLLVDARGRITSWNKGAERITGYSASQMTGSLYQDCPVKPLAANGKEFPADSIPLLLTIRDGRPRESLSHFKHAAGYLVSTIAKTMAIRDKKGSLKGGVMIFNDNKTLIAAYKLNLKVEETVLLDSLTGIGSRPHIEMKIRGALEQFQENQARFGILFIDIDHFKNFNDEYGHLAGDKMLRLVANTLSRNLRVTDSCGRWGGEEFVALVLDIHADGLTLVADKLRARVSQASIEEDGKKMSVTISIGATIVNPKDTLETLLQRADELLYKSKQDGRNRVTVRE